MQLSLHYKVIFDTYPPFISSQKDLFVWFFICPNQQNNVLIHLISLINNAHLVVFGALARPDKFFVCFIFLFCFMVVGVNQYLCLSLSVEQLVSFGGVVHRADA